MKKRTIFILFALLASITMSFITVNAVESDVNILLNGKAVIFNDDTGYPYVDENNRTMVPLRVTMESAGFVVGYDGEKQTAIVITEHDRIEVPIGTNIIYENNNRIENDTIAVVKNGRTYLPIRAVLEAANYTVEWEANSNSVIAYTYKYNSTDFVPYNTSSLETLVSRVLSGEVVYVNGQFYATPEFVKMLNTVQVHYTGSDLNTAIYPQASRYDLVDFDVQTQPEVQSSDNEWVSEDEFWKLESGYEFGFVTTSDGLGYGFIKSSGLTGTVSEQIVSKGLPLDFADADREITEFDGIRFKAINGEIFINLADLKAKGIIE